MPEKREKRRRLIQWNCCCDDPSCSNRFLANNCSSVEAIAGSQASTVEENEVEHSTLYIDTHVHLNDVFMKIQVQEEVPSLGKTWDAMSDEERRAWTTLGFDRAKWNGQTDGNQTWCIKFSRYGAMYFENNVTGEQTWDKPDDLDDAFVDEAWKSQSWDEEHEDRDPFTVEWADLYPQERQAVIELGYKEGTWDQSGIPVVPSPEVLRRYTSRFACVSSGCDPEGLEHMLLIHRSIPLPPERVMDTAALDEGFPGFVWAALGCHPKAAATFSLQELDKAWDSLQEFEAQLRAAASEMGRRLIAWGEIGLDYSHPLYGPNKMNQWFQKQALERQLAIGMEFGLPLVIHSREAWEDTMSILTKHVPRDYRIHLHCFWDDQEAMEEFINVFPNAVLGFTNNLFYADAMIEQLCRCVPLRHVVLETDAPYLPRTGSSMSHMGDIPAIGKKVAELRGISFETVMDAVRQNVARIYGI